MTSFYFRANYYVSYELALYICLSLFLITSISAFDDFYKLFLEF